MNNTTASHWQALILAAASSTDNFLVGVSVGVSGKGLPAEVLWGIALCNAAGCGLATWVAGEGGQRMTKMVERIALAYSNSLDGGGGDAADGDSSFWSNSNSSYGISSIVGQYLIAAAAFAYLAWQEHREQQQQLQNTQSTSPPPASLQLALPMTLNNLAGGVTGGVLGLNPWINLLYAFLVSVVTMVLGWWLGKRMAITQQRHAQQQHKRNDDWKHDGDGDTTNTTGLEQWNLAPISIALYLLLSAQSLYDAYRAWHEHAITHQ